MTPDITDVDTERFAQITTDATESLLKAYHKRLDRELVAAWMAGYNYLDVVKEPLSVYQHRQQADDIAFKVKMAFIPIRAEGTVDRPQVYPPGYSAQRYDLSKITPGMAREARRCPPD